MSTSSETEDYSMEEESYSTKETVATRFVKFNSSQQASNSFNYSRNAMPEIGIYPSSIVFHNTFPNIPVQQKVIITNSGNQEEKFKIYIQGNSEFSVSTTDVQIPQGGTYAFIVSFKPEVVSLYNGSLIIEGRTSRSISITGHCIPSPLEFPEPESPVWIFPKIKSSKSIEIANKSLSMSLSVTLATNCLAFTVRPNALQIPPSSTSEINLTYDPQLSGCSQPQIFIQCDESGDSADIPLTFSTPKPKIEVDFGIVSLGIHSVQVLKLKTPSIPPTIPWPFTLENLSHDNEPQRKFVFGFTPREVGDVRTSVQLIDYDVELRALAVDPPYRLKIPQSFPSKPFSIQNISDNMLRLQFNVIPDVYGLDFTKAKLRPSQSAEYHIFLHERTKSKDNLILQIYWKYIDGRIVCDNHEIPSTQIQGSFIIGDDEMELRKNRESMSTQKDLDSINRTNVSKKSKRNRNKNQDIESEENTEVLMSTALSPTKTEYPSSIKAINADKMSNNSKTSYSLTNPIVSSSQIIPFFKVSSTNPASFELIINSESQFNCEAPDWINIPHYLRSNEPITLKCSSIPTSMTISSLSISTQNSQLDIPVIAYRGQSKLDIPTKISLDPVTSKQFNTKIIITNTGSRAGFIAFTSPQELDCVLVSPPIAVIQPNNSTEFTFVVKSEESFSYPLISYSSDEIIRQMKALVSPKDMFSTAFADIETKDELSFFSTIIQQCKPRDINKLFKKYTAVTQILLLGEKKMENQFSEVTISPTQIEFIGNEKMRLSLLNLSSNPLDFTAISPTSNVVITPLSGEVSPYSEAVLHVQMLHPCVTSLKVTCGTQVFKVPLSQISSPSKRKKYKTYKEDTIIEKKNKRPVSFLNDFDPPPNGASGFISTKKSNPVTYFGGFSISDAELDFGTVETGTSKQLEIIISNDENQTLVLKSHSTNPEIFACPDTFNVPPSGKTKIRIEFHPDDTQKYQEMLIIESEDNQLCVKLYGEGTDGAMSLCPMQSTALEFPPCEPGTIRRAQLRISNGTTRKTIISANVEKPFRCPIPQFEIEPQSYVLVPVHFISMKIGHYEAELDLNSIHGSKATVLLIGNCIEY